LAWKKLSEETKQKMKQSQKERYERERRKKEIGQLDFLFKIK